MEYIISPVLFHRNCKEEKESGLRSEKTSKIPWSTKTIQKPRSAKTSEMPLITFFLVLKLLLSITIMMIKIMMINIFSIMVIKSNAIYKHILINNREGIVSICWALDFCSEVIPSLALNYFTLIEKVWSLKERICWLDYIYSVFHCYLIYWTRKNVEQYLVEIWSQNVVTGEYCLAFSAVY